MQTLLSLYHPPQNDKPLNPRNLTHCKITQLPHNALSFIIPKNVFSMAEFLLASLLLGAIAGMSAGLFGLGGGVVIVPILAWMLTIQKIPEELVMIMAVATSLSTIIFTSVSSIFAHHKRGYVLWSKIRYLSLGIVMGVTAGAFIAEHITAERLRLIFGIYLIYVSLQILLQINPANLGDAKENPLLDSGIGIIIGAVSAILGIGGGTLTVPYLVHRHVPIKNAVATSSVCGFPIAVAATISYALLGMKNSSLPEWSFGYVYLPAFLGISLCSVFTAPLGAKLVHILPAEKLKRYFALVLFLIAVKMLWH